ncbi:TetR/AcrR family transcriptional regulator [Oleomonas cavernae]|uniref:TetR/AcrR family transcriptional regulator n=1 Tax=Oleomonas cavernae TaxID=2320859 RepID=UPI001314C8E2|nr:TetR/AcrR family transcriptional regulator [Oleomonas cavernae]
MLDAARRLFIERGYEQTTIREISVASGVSSGSLYHFFSDKEGVFLHLTLEVFEGTLQAAASAAARYRDPHLGLSLKWAFLVRLISTDRRLAELFSVAYGSWKISEALLRVATQRHQLLLGGVLDSWDQERFFIATLVLAGVLSALVEERVNLDCLSEEKRVRALLSTALPAFGARPEKIQGLIEKTLELLSSITLSSVGFGEGDHRA